MMSSVKPGPETGLRVNDVHDRAEVGGSRCQGLH